MFDLLKVVVNGHLMDMEEVEPTPTDELIQEDCVVDSHPEDVGKDKDKE